MKGIKGHLDHCLLGRLFSFFHVLVKIYHFRTIYDKVSIIYSVSVYDNGYSYVYFCWTYCLKSVVIFTMMKTADILREVYLMRPPQQLRG